MTTLQLPTLWESFKRSLETNADRDAVAADGRTYTYKEIGHAVATMTARLTEVGVKTGHRVLLLTDCGAAFVVADLAVMALGAVKVPLNAHLALAEITGIVERVEPTAVVMSDSLRDRAAAIPTRVAILVDALRVDPGMTLPEMSICSADDPAVVYFTGGTTGRPKGIVHSQAGVLTNLWAHLLEAGITRDERLLLTTPMAHAAGLFSLAALLRGAYVRFERVFDAGTVLDVVDNDDITWTFAVPTMIYRLLDAAAVRNWTPKSLRTIQYGGAPITAVRLREALDRFGPALQQLYAQTEAPNYGCVLRKEDHVAALEQDQLLRSCGRASIMCDVSIRDEDGVDLGAGEAGEICLRTPYVMSGYWDDADGFSRRFFGDWLRTGDVGHRDANGYVYIVDRKADMIVTGGMNVYSLEVEQVLVKSPGVTSVAVIGIPHDDWGEAVHAVVVGEHVDIDQLASYAREHLAAYKRPKTYDICDALPLTTYGKVDRKALRAGFWGDRDRAVN